MNKQDVKLNQVFINRYGLLLRVERIEKRGVVRVFGHAGSWDIHQGLTEWADLNKNWKLKN